MPGTRDRCAARSAGLTAGAFASGWAGPTRSCRRGVQDPFGADSGRDGPRAVRGRWRRPFLQERRAALRLRVTTSSRRPGRSGRSGRRPGRAALVEDVDQQGYFPAVRLPACSAVRIFPAWEVEDRLVQVSAETLGRSALGVRRPGAPAPRDAFGHRLLADAQLVRRRLKTARRRLPPRTSEPLRHRPCRERRRHNQRLWCSEGCLPARSRRWFTRSHPGRLSRRVDMDFVQKVQRDRHGRADQRARACTGQQEEIQQRWSELTGQAVDETTTRSRPFTDHGVNIRVGRTTSSRHRPLLQRRRWHRGRRRRDARPRPA